MPQSWLEPPRPLLHQVQPVPLLAQGGDVAREVTRREIRPRHEGHARVRDDAEWREAALDAEGKLAIQRRRRREPDVMDQQRVAVGSRLRDARGGDGAARARHVLRRHGLAQLR
jgi:hypothetical protein